MIHVVAVSSFGNFVWSFWLHICYITYSTRMNVEENGYTYAQGFHRAEGGGGGVRSPLLNSELME